MVDIDIVFPENMAMNVSEFFKKFTDLNGAFIEIETFAQTTLYLIMLDNRGQLHFIDLYMGCILDRQTFMKKHEFNSITRCYEGMLIAKLQSVIAKLQPVTGPYVW